MPEPTNEFIICPRCARPSGMGLKDARVLRAPEDLMSKKSRNLNMTPRSC